MSDGTERNLRPGLKVAIILKKDQRSRVLTHGVVDTSAAKHTRGIKVRLTDGQVGRVQSIRSE